MAGDFLTTFTLLWKLACLICMESNTGLILGHGEVQRDQGHSTDVQFNVFVRETSSEKREFKF